MLAAFFAIIIINILTFALFWFDKHQAVNGQWRVPENTLIFMAASGGSAGALIAMEAFRHKTQKRAFSVGVPYLIIAQVIIFVIIANIFL